VVRRQTGASREEVSGAYAFARNDPAVQALVTSAFYHHRLRVAFAVDTVREWTAEPDRPRRILAGEPVLSRTVELHPSTGTCNYRCTMCLWSDREELTYEQQRLTADGLLSTGAWMGLLDRLHQMGARTVVVSGGGEALLNRDLAAILNYARTLGLRRHVYTTGFNLDRASEELWTELARCDQVRFSIHAADEDLYSRIVGLPPRVRALTRVTEHLRRLIDLRDRLASPGRVGIGFVAQPANHAQLSPMTDLAVGCGVDFLNIRKDEVDVTATLTDAQAQVMLGQVRRLRLAGHRSEHGRTVVDFSDEITALANGIQPAHRRTAECHAKYFRPTISPYGILAPCDLKAEPRFAGSEFNLGIVSAATLGAVVATLPRQTIPDACAQCMPSSRTGNAVYAKLLDDLRDGIALSAQPFAQP
jgi:MoaA/NifB/PqqE/SkfB family radical SAM enzyme